MEIKKLGFNMQKADLTRPSKSPITNPISKPSIDRRDIDPEYDTSNIPDEMPPPIDFPEIDPERIPAVDPKHPPIS